MDAEIWKDVVGFEGLYEVSNYGEVRSRDRIVNQAGYYGTSRKILIRGKVLKGWMMNGYRYMGIRQPKGAVVTVAVHVIVLAAFVGPRPNGHQCCHNDGNKLNNYAGNLRWDTPQKNMDDREKHGTHAKGSACKRSKLTEANIPDIRKLLAEGGNRWGLLSEIARTYGVDAATIRDIKIGKTWTHVPEFTE